LVIRRDRRLCPQEIAPSSVTFCFADAEKYTIFSLYASLVPFGVMETLLLSPFCNGARKKIVGHADFLRFQVNLGAYTLHRQVQKVGDGRELAQQFREQSQPIVAYCSFPSSP